MSQVPSIRVSLFCNFSDFSYSLTRVIKKQCSSKSVISLSRLTAQMEDYGSESEEEDDDDDDDEEDEEEDSEDSDDGY